MPHARRSDDRVRRFPGMTLQEPWPQFAATLQDRAFQPLGDAYDALMRAERRGRRRALIADSVEAIGKGVILGVIGYSFYGGVLQLWDLWIAGTYWVFEILAFLLVMVLGGFEVAIFFGTLGLFIKSLITWGFAPMAMGLAILSGILLRLILETLPVFSIRHRRQTGGILWRTSPLSPNPGRTALGQVSPLPASTKQGEAPIMTS